MSQENVNATEKILLVIQTVAETLPRLELYSQFLNDLQFQTALVHLFADISEFAAHAYRLLGRRTFSKNHKKFLFGLY
jgi:hypothetical protein